MNASAGDPAPGGDPAAPPAPASGGDAVDYARLRELILGHERRALEAAAERLDAIDRLQRDLPARLPEALETGSAQAPERMADALARPVSQALAATVQREPQVLIDALFPVIGPMIRKAIAEALRHLVGDLNGALESSFTLRGLRWRMEAWRAGVPYAQIVLRHRSTFAVDHLFLIERANGLLLHRQSAPGLAPLDADAVAGMLTALGDFVGDSVGGGRGNALESMQVGEYLVWVVPGPRANLAAFLRGVPSPALRGVLEQRLETLHALFTAHPEADGSLPDLAPARVLLAPESILASASEGAPVENATSRRPLVFAGLLVAAVLLALLVWHGRWRERVDRLHAALSAHPGFVMTGFEASHRRGVRVRGLLDPEAAPLATAIAAAGWNDDPPQLELGGVVSTDDAVIARRAERLLAPPAGVRLAVTEGRLTLTGTAPAAWIDHARQRAAWVPGVGRVAADDLAPSDAGATPAERLQAALTALAALRVDFANATEPGPTADADVAAIATAIASARAAAQAAGRSLHLDAFGSTDDSGSSLVNERLRQARAEWLMAALSARGIVGLRLATSPDDALERRRSAGVRAAILDVPPPVSRP